MAKALDNANSSSIVKPFCTVVAGVLPLRDRGRPHLPEVGGEAVRYSLEGPVAELTFVADVGGHDPSQFVIAVRSLGSAAPFLVLSHRDPFVL